MVCAISATTIAVKMQSINSQLRPSIGIFVVGYNRGFITLQILRNISQMVDLPIFLALDGPREPKDRFQQDQLVSAIQSSGLQVSVVIGTENRGCARGVINSIDALFEVSNSTIGIILEDDCWPTASFFKFVQESVSKLASDWLTITGQCVGLNLDESFSFINYPLIHGWAISKEKWDEILRRIIEIDHIRFEKDIPWKMKTFVRRTMSKVDNGYLDTWDSHFTYASWGLRQPNVCKIGASVFNVGEMSSRDPKTVKEMNYSTPVRSRLVKKDQENAYIEEFFFGVTFLRALLWASLNHFNAVVRLIRRGHLPLGKRIFSDLKIPTSKRYSRAYLSRRPK